MLFIALAKFKTPLSKEVVARNLKDIESDTKGQIKYLGIWWTLLKVRYRCHVRSPGRESGDKYGLKKGGPDGDRDARGLTGRCSEPVRAGLTGWLI